jgi:hypothetical protein
MPLTPARIPTLVFYGEYSLLTMETAAIIGLALFLASEVLPFLPIPQNGLVQAIVAALIKVFPKPEKK